MTLATPTTSAAPDTAQDTGCAVAGQGPAGRATAPKPPATLTVTLGRPRASHHTVVPLKVQEEMARAGPGARATTAALRAAPAPARAAKALTGGVGEAEPPKAEAETVTERVGTLDTLRVTVTLRVRESVVLAVDEEERVAKLEVGRGVVVTVRVPDRVA